MPPAKRTATTANSKSSPKSKTSKAAGSSAAKSRAKATTDKAADSKTAGKAAADAATGKAAATKASTTNTAASKRSAAKASSGTRAGAKRVPRAAAPPGGVISIAEELAKGAISPKDIVMLTREHIQETFDDAASRGRVTRKDANELVTELVRRGRSGGDDLRSELEHLLGTGRKQIGSATKRAARSQPVDRIVRGADRARRATPT